MAQSTFGAPSRPQAFLCGRKRQHRSGGLSPTARGQRRIAWTTASASPIFQPRLSGTGASGGDAGVSPRPNDRHRRPRAASASCPAFVRPERGWTTPNEWAGPMAGRHGIPPTPLVFMAEMASALFRKGRVSCVSGEKRASPMRTGVEKGRGLRLGAVSCRHAATFLASRRSSLALPHLWRFRGFRRVMILRLGRSTGDLP